MSSQVPGGRRIHIAQGEHAIGDDKGTVITTILGSCVAVCLWDPDRRIGGMNHILIPGGGVSDLGARGAGATAMERLINALMKAGARRDRLTAKVFGGASIVAGLSDIGARNAAFALDYLRAEGIGCQSRSVGGRMARQIRYWPESGRAQQRLVPAGEAPTRSAAQPARANGLELL